MAGSSSAPALVATFVFGLVVLAASAAIFFFVKASKSPLIRDELRLALSFFLAASALWGILDFAATLVHENSASACQTVISFAAVFDQVARVSVQQFLLWAVNGGIKVTKLSLAMQGALLVRFILGAVFVGVQRPQFEPVCVASNLVLPIGVIVMVTDVAMTVALSTKVVLAKKSNAIRPELSRTNALIFVTAGLGIWTGLSIPLFLGLKSSSLAVRTVLPAIGILILIGVVALSMRNFVPSPSASTLKIQKTVSFESTTHIEEPTRNLQAQAFPPQNMTTRVAGVLPLITQPANGQADRGMGGLPVEGELFPPMRAQVAAPRVHHKKQMSDKAFNGGKVVISKPIVPAGTEPSNFDHIPTIDLATAAMKERERRELRPLPFSNIDAALDGALSTREMMEKLQTSKRKPVPQSTSPKNSRNFLSVEEPSVAMTSAVQLSPGMEETRRRSPRQPYQADGPSPSPPMIPSKDEARTPKSAPLQAATTVLVPPPRSSKRPPPIKPLLSRTTKDINALPAVSRFSVSTMDPMTARITSSMFSPQEQKSARAVPPPRQTLPPPPPPVAEFWVDPRTASLPRSNSVKNNIRPSRRAPPSPPVEEEEVKETRTPLQRRATVGLPHNPRARATRMFTSQRSKSNDQQIMFLNNEEESATVLVVPAPEEDVESPSRKSIIHRPRPIPRKSTASASELLGISALPSQDEFTIVSTPNLPLISPVGVKTLSQSSYGATSPGSLTRRKTVRRTSFVPDLPAVPVEYQGQQPKIAEDAALDVAGTSVWTVAPNDQGFQMPSSDKKTQRALCVSKFSVDTSLTAEEPRLSYNSRLSVNTQSSYEETIGRNSSVVFASESKATAISTMVNSLSERPLKHESVDSEFSMMLRNAPVPPKTAPIENRVTEEDDRMVEAPFVLDMSKYESSTALESEYQSTAQQMVSWHHRVGEELPSFSSQLTYRRNRKLLVPKPLALYRPANVTVVIEAEPSPVEPDQEALDRIHEQLKNFDTENGDSRATISEQQRMTILANLESEMGAQESQWQMLKVDLGPSSPSTVVSSPGINSLRSSVDISKFEMIPITKLNASAGDLIVALKEEANHRLSKSSDQLLKEETPESGDDKFNRRSLSASGRMSLISVTNRLSQIGSPTPPDTDESGEDSDNDSMVEGTGSTKDLSTALMPRSQVSTVTSFLALDEVLSSSTEDVQSKLDVPVEFEDVSLITPKAQTPKAQTPKAQPPLVLPQPEEPKTESAKPAEPETIRFSLADLEQPAPRPRSVTRRPPRQSKRISALPDIVENPEPLAGKIGSLGIFQFAWGEKSDSARVPPRMTGLSGTMSSGRARMNPPPTLLSSVHEAQTNYPPVPAQSFLDDDEMDNGLGNYEDEDYDDGFDENTLWEIASLLESDLDGSRDDLFMVGEEEYWEDQVAAADDIPSATSPVEEASESVKEEAYDFIPVTLASENSSDVFKVPTLWTGDMKGQTTKSLGLPQPSEGAWEYSTAAPRSARTISRMMEEPAQLSSSSLWMAASAGVSMYTSGLWASLMAHHGKEKETKSVKVSPSAIKSLVWSPSSSTKVSGLGLPQPDIRLWNAYIPQETRSVRKTTQMPQPATIASKSLWALKPVAKPSMSNGVWSPVNKSEAKLPTVALPALWLPLSFANGTTVGLPQPDASVWNSFIAPTARTAYRASRMPQPAVIASTSLWKPRSIITPSASTGVWSPSPKEATVKVTSLAILAIVPSLWSPISTARNGALGLPQPDIQVWNAYTQPESRIARRTSRKEQQLKTQSAVMWSTEPLRTIELVSTKLWSLKKTTLLWAPTPFKGASIGLPQPDGKTWNTYIVLPARSIRHKANDFKYETIKSISLWQPSPAVVPHSGGVWKAKSLAVEPTRESRSDSSFKMVKDLLWSVSSTKTPSVGLPQPDAMTWSMYLLPASRSHRSAYVPKPIMITSTSLWTPALSTESPSGGVWEPKSLPSKSQVAKPSQVSHMEPAVAVVRDLLWSSSPAKMISLGLPQPDAKFWTAYLVPAGRSHRRAYVPKVIAISSTSLWSHTSNVETQSDGVWKPKSKASATQEIKVSQKPVKANKGSLWTLPLAKKASVGLPQPDSKAWESYIPPMTRSTFRRVLTSEPASVEGQSLWSLPLIKEAASGYLWRPSKMRAEKKRPTVQTTFAIRSAATPSPAASSAAAESPVPAIAARAAGVRTSTPVLMTQEQWKLAFKRISQDVQKDSAAAPSSNHASRARPTRLNRSQSVKSRPVFDPSVMALISELPSPHQGLGRSKSISFLPPSRKTSSHGPSASLPNAEPSQPATSSLI